MLHFTRKAILGLVLLLAAVWPLYAQGGDDPAPPSKPVKLIFIHHSCGENWLNDDHGGLGRVLAQNNYFVSDTNYGWGPDAIGDNTDITNWLAWFRGPDSARYLAALYAESGQNSPYSRAQPDPGGENEIVMFKSCFPNSMLEGSPTDPAAPGDGLTVSNAKYIYNDLLKYFATRPDKLFIVITAPPVQDPSLAANARAFNTWLVNTWLAENSYTLPNVAVFDFYNVLTGPGNHHRFQNGAVEYVANQGSNTSAYPSAADDDHPAAEGNRKAAAEFVPLLNVFYHRWQAGAPAQGEKPALPTPTATAAPAEAVEPTPTSAEAAAIAPSAPAGNMIDAFESGSPAASQGWQTFSDPATDTQITCQPDTTTAKNGQAALKISFDVAAGSWSGCSLIYEAPQAWQSGAGLAFYLRADQAGRPFSVAVYGGSPDKLTTFVYFTETPPDSANAWARVEIPWSDLRRATWEAEGEAPVDPAGVVGIAFGFDGLEKARHTGAVWVDDIQLAEEIAAAPAEATSTPAPEPTATTAAVAATPELPSATATLSQPTAAPPTVAPTAASAPAAGRGFCGGAAMAPLALLGLVWVRRRWWI